MNEFWHNTSKKDLYDFIQFLLRQIRELKETNKVLIEEKLRSNWMFLHPV